MSRRNVFAWAALLAVVTATSASAGQNDAILTQFFAIWDDNTRVTAAAVGELYAPRVVYYGRAMTVGQIYANKRDFIRRWPSRRYSVVPGTADERCDGAKSNCSVGVTLAWRAESAARGATAGGWTRVSFHLVRVDGELKIDRESGRSVTRPGTG